MIAKMENLKCRMRHCEHKAVVNVKKYGFRVCQLHHAIRYSDVPSKHFVSEKNTLNLYWGICWALEEFTEYTNARDDVVETAEVIKISKEFQDRMEIINQRFKKLTDKQGCLDEYQSIDEDMRNLFTELRKHPLYVKYLEQKDSDQIIDTLYKKGEGSQEDIVEDVRRKTRKQVQHICDQFNAKRKDLKAKYQAMEALAKEKYENMLREGLEKAEREDQFKSRRMEKMVKKQENLLNKKNLWIKELKAKLLALKLLNVGQDRHLCLPPSESKSEDAINKEMSRALVPFNSTSSYRPIEDFELNPMKELECKLEF
ncbi:unnamed protein product [Moneuplotes crassus]|uniref:Uncharacterized protein n=1 Tax=Euplotes crassus TaxID=5936 RepID=A0AAD2D735_EUPCR|nr:unnamed protein product [Moneuplotes crassus]